MNLQPAIKWSGSKRSQARQILEYFPKKIDTYYEPFCGGASILGALLLSDIKANNYICSDINDGLILLWNAIKNAPSELMEDYKVKWEKLVAYTELDDRKKYFAEIREAYNENHNAKDFLFIMRTTTNGMPRYNSKGKFNNSFHVTRTGMNPDRLTKILGQWSELLNQYNVKFICQSYSEITCTETDMAYLDPPYANTQGMYYGHFDNIAFFEWLAVCPAFYLLSYDGKGRNFDNTYQVPENLYSQQLYLKSGNSSFRRVIGKDTQNVIYESLYIK